ncbi:helix-turn-helix domain-containing protein [Vagococcus fluvialis]|uniref:helix-turn-helix domain-containing protein n=1 Tax=Vagococcus fluvialis TaxID=2738 RepID=UPI003B20C629
MSRLSDTLKEIRIDKKMTMIELSKYSGASQSYISQLENGKRKPTVEALRNIAKGLSFNGEDYNKDEEDRYFNQLEKAMDDDQLQELILSSDDIVNRFNLKDSNEQRVLLEAIKKNTNDYFVPLEGIYLNDPNKEFCFTIAGEPLNEEETQMLKTLIIGIKSLRIHE